MRKTDPILDEIHEIRRQINEETKDMTDEECTAYFKQSVEAAVKESGYKIVYLDEKRTQCRFEKI